MAHFEFMGVKWLGPHFSFDLHLIHSSRRLKMISGQARGLQGSTLQTPGFASGRASQLV